MNSSLSVLPKTQKTTPAIIILNQKMKHQGFTRIQNFTITDAMMTWSSNLHQPSTTHRELAQLKGQKRSRSKQRSRDQHVVYPANVLRYLRTTLGVNGQLSQGGEIQTDERTSGFKDTYLGRQVISRFGGPRAGMGSAGDLGSAASSPSGSGVEPQPKSNLVLFSLKIWHQVGRQ